jgi:ATP-dependent RNA helicase DHX36
MTTESFRKEVAKKLNALQADPDDGASVAFPSDLTSSDRKYIHQMAQSFRLHSQSVGKGDDRCIHIFKSPPDGHEDRRQGSHASRAQGLDLSDELRQQLEMVASSAPPHSGRPALATVRPYSNVRPTPQAKAKAAIVPLAEGDAVEGYWPDDDEWLPAVLSALHEDGSYRIVWDADGSESDVPNDYVRRLGGEDVEMAGMEDAIPMCTELMESTLDARRQEPGYAAIGEKREQLPAFLQREEAIQTIRDNQVCLLVGETGCGKSTQIPQLILDSCPDAKILVMQPRKLAAVTLAERICVERCQSIGQEVGYDAPFAKKGQMASLVFTTLGVFRQKLLRDPELRGITHVIFDEVHERDKLADFNMIFMRDLLQRRSDLRLVLMSATLQMETFEAYFENAAKIEIPGRVYPVSELYLDEVCATLYKQPIFRMFMGPGILCGGIDIPAGAEGDWNEKQWKTIVFKHTAQDDKETLWGLRDKGLESQMMAPMSRDRLLDGLRKHDVLQQSGLAFDYPIIEALILHVDRMYKAAQKNLPEGEEPKPAGTILVFLPGWGDIDNLKKRLVTNFDTNRFKILPLHSQVSAEEQAQIFQPAPQGMRKIVLTTNIAEASITVEGTEFIIDSGRAKEVSYDPYLKVGTLTTSWISQASSKQRAGRAGRTQGGLCFHLMCRDRFQKLDEYLAPELLRSPLEDSALTAKLMLLQMGSKEKVSSFLAKAPSPPEPIAIQNSLDLLIELGAFTSGEQLTALGQHLTNSALPPRLAKTVLWAILLGCLDDALCVVSAASGFTRDPFRLQHLPREEAQKVKRSLAAPYNSDHACLMKAVSGYTDSTNQEGFCSKWNLAAPTMRQIRDQQNRIFTELKENKSEGFANRNRGNFELLFAVLCAGIFPNVARRRGSSDFLETQGGKVEARPHATSAYIPEKHEEWVIFQELAQVESTYKLKVVTPVQPLVMLLLGGEGPIAIEEGDGKSGKGKKGSWGKGGGKSQVFVSLLDGWVKFQTDRPTADLIQSLRASLQGAFQGFVQKPDHVPAAPTLEMLDQVAALLTDVAGGGATGHGVKRPHGGDGESMRNVSAKILPVKGKGGGKGGKGGKWGKGGKGGWQW